MIILLAQTLYTAFRAAFRPKRTNIAWKRSRRYRYY